jgi:hypothetical protein
VIFLRPSRKIQELYLKLGHDPSIQILSNSSFTNRHFIRRYIVLVTEKASLNKL